MNDVTKLIEEYFKTSPCKSQIIFQIICASELQTKEIERILAHDELNIASKDRS